MSDVVRPSIRSDLKSQEGARGVQGGTLLSPWRDAIAGAAAAQPRRAATLRVAGASEGCRFAAAGPNNVRQGRYLPCAHGPSRAASSMLREGSERADNRLDKDATHGEATVPI